MRDNLKAMQRKHMAFIGENSVDIVLYISKICSFNHKILVIDLSSTNCLLDIVSPDGYMENQNIRYATYKSVEMELEYSYDLVITFSDMLQNIPSCLLCGDAYVFTTPGKNNFNKIPKEIKHLKINPDNIFIVCKGSENSDTLMKKMFLSGIPPLMINKMFFICDNDNDSAVMWRMEYNSVFLYESLSMDLRKFLIFVYNRTYEMFDISPLPEGVRFKWVM
jgi:hypothetical protein